MIIRSVDAIEKSDIEALIENQVREWRTIEYKKVLPGNSDDDKREFLADLSSFANAGGGDLLFGISAKDGVPQEALGVEGNIDAELLRLENILRDGLDPRIPGYRIKAIDGFSKGPVLLIRIPKSWAAPHIIKFKNYSRFYTRHSTGKHQMDVSEIRAAFLLSEALPEKIKRFRDERLGRIIADETPVVLKNGAKLTVHILPVVAFTRESNIDLSSRSELSKKLKPIGGGGWNNRFNFDGFITYSGSNNSISKSYCQLFRRGQIEAVLTDFVREINGGQFIPSNAFENYTVGAISGYLNFLKSIEIECPILVFITLSGVLNVSMATKADFPSGETIDHDILTLPDILIDAYESVSDINGVAKTLRPAFDAVWNACGYEYSYNYDENGNWNPK